MKYFLSFVLIFLAFSSYAQEPAYTPMNSNYKFRGIRVDSLFLIPSFADTNAANTQRCATIAGSMIRTGNDFWMRNATATSWLQNVNIGTGASPVLSFVNEVFKKAGTDSVFYVVAPHDTFFSFKDQGIDTTSLSNRIDNKIEDLKRSSDSVYYQKNNTWIFAYIDSVPVKDTPTLKAVLAKDRSTANSNFFVGIFSGDAQTGTNNTYIGNNSGANHTGSRNNFLGYYSGYNSTSTDANIMGYNAGTYNIYSYVNLFGNNVTADENNQVVFGKNSYPNNKNARISYNSLSADRKYRLPDSSGTIALLENITGGGQNFANADLTATGNRLHNFKNYDLNIDSIKSYQLSFYPQYSGDYGSSLHMEQSYGNMLSYDDLGRYSGFGYNAPLNYAFLINKNNTAYLSRRAFGSDTLAMLSDLANAGQNFANADLNATGNRTHNFKSKSLNIDSCSSLLFQTQTYSGDNKLDLGDGNGGVYIDKAGDYWGLTYSSDYNYTMLRNKSNNAYLSRRAFGNDTLALLSDIVGGPDSPDRINGTATDDVESDFDTTHNMTFKNGGVFYVSEWDEIQFNPNQNQKLRLVSDSIIVDNTLFFRDGAANRGTIKAADKLTIRTDTLTFSLINEVGMADGNLYAQLVKINDCTAVDTLFIDKPGFYKVTNVGVIPTLIDFPDASLFPGASIILFNADNVDPVDFTTPKPQQANGTNVSIQGKETAYHYASDGTNWIWLYE